MLTPTVANRLNWLYAIGNTPATSLTRSVPIGKDVDILSLGCGDVRNILYTSYVEQGMSPRKIDITCCDYDENVIGRNVILLSLLFDNDFTIKKDHHIWDLYYHLFVADEAVEVMLEHLQKLLPLLESLESWKAGIYGRTIKFCDQHTLDDVRSVCTKILEGARHRSGGNYGETYNRNLKKTIQCREYFAAGSTAINITGMRSAAPVSLKSTQDMIEASQTYNRFGAVTPTTGRQGVPNPMFASLVSEGNVLHYGSNPVLGYHLATAFAPLSKTSPLRVPDQVKDFRAAEAAKIQFSAWITAFRAIAHERLMVRFTVADAFACCHTLQYAGATRKTSANWYRRQWSLQTLTLDDAEYGSKGKGPTRFDVIDTSNLSDHVGALNILTATSPLLNPQPWATLYTEILLKRGKTRQEEFEKLLCGRPATMSLLLGVSPVQYWTNAKCESHVDELFVGAMGSAGGSGIETQLHNRLIWKRDDQFSGQLDGRSRVHVDEPTLVRILFDVYLQMFSVEDDKASEAILTRSAAYTHFHRGNFASFLKVVKHRVKTDWEAVCSKLIEKISENHTLALSKNQLQELGVQMHLQNVSTESWLLFDNAACPKAGPFRRWKNVPLCVAVTVVIPRRALDQLYEGTNQHKMASPTLVGSLRAAPGSANQWHSMYSDVQITFGTVTNAPESEKAALLVEEDIRGWTGDSPLIASFIVPTAALQIDPVHTVVEICIPPSAQAARLYARTLGPEMSVYKTKISVSSEVFVTGTMPGLGGHRLVGEGVRPFKDAIDGANGEHSNKLLLEVPASESHITTVVGHVDILSDKGKKMLQDKVPIELVQRDPFTIDVVFGDKKLVCPMKFPVPISQVGSRSRVARKSGFVEIIGPVASSKDSPVLADFLYPSQLDREGLPAALNASHLNLDALPVIDVEDKEHMRWLVTLGSLQFSKGEKQLRDEGGKRDGINESVRINFKESIFTMLMLSSGLQGGQTGLFAINHPGQGGIHMLFFISAIRLDADNSSVILDAAVIPFTSQLISSNSMQDFLLILRSLEIATIHVNDEELILWKKALVAWTERCRTYNHRANCEYKRRGATAPVNLDFGQKVMCSCGKGKLPRKFMSLPHWNVAASNAVRVAISPTFSVPMVEDILDPADATKAKGQLASTDRCRRCGTEKTQDGGSLKKCMRCQVVKYCSADCQKKDWKKHRMECMEAD